MVFYSIKPLELSISKIPYESILIKNDTISTYIIFMNR